MFVLLSINNILIFIEAQMSGDLWYIKVAEGKKAGPVTFDKLCELVKQGKVVTTTALRRTTDSAWFSASLVDRLFSDVELTAVKSSNSTQVNNVAKVENSDGQEQSVTTAVAENLGIPISDNLPNNTAPVIVSHDTLDVKHSENKSLSTQTQRNSDFKVIVPKENYSIKTNTSKNDFKDCSVTDETKDNVELKCPNLSTLNRLEKIGKKSLIDSKVQVGSDKVEQYSSLLAKDCKSRFPAEAALFVPMALLLIGISLLIMATWLTSLTTYVPLLIAICFTGITLLVLYFGMQTLTMFSMIVEMLDKITSTNDSETERK
ncbi:MAG: GYF domain-containing protein [Planctomycetaceae bacterium]|jgi:hypothetical protein|nr:GYF domain-containing protein [Planctomycetaceae bacterium]